MCRRERDPDAELWSPGVLLQPGGEAVDLDAVLEEARLSCDDQLHLLVRAKPQNGVDERAAHADVDDRSAGAARPHVQLDPQIAGHAPEAPALRGRRDRRDEREEPMLDLISSRAIGGESTRAQLPGLELLELGEEDAELLGLQKITLPE